MLLCTYLNIYVQGDSSISTIMPVHITIFGIRHLASQILIQYSLLINVSSHTPTFPYQEVRDISKQPFTVAITLSPSRYVERSSKLVHRLFHHLFLDWQPSLAFMLVCIAANMKMGHSTLSYTVSREQKIDASAFSAFQYRPIDQQSRDLLLNEVDTYWQLYGNIASYCFLQSAS